MTDPRSATTTGSSIDSHTDLTQRSGGPWVGAVAALSRQAGRALTAAKRRGAAGARLVRPAGWLAVVVGVVGTTAGLVWGWAEWLAAGVGALVLLAVAALFLIGARSYAVDVQLERDRIAAGDPIDARLIVRNAGRRPLLPGRIDLPVGDGLMDVAIPALRPGRASERALQIAPQPRGILRVGPATSVRSDPLGLLSREQAAAGEREVYVHPRMVRVPSLSTGLLRDLDGAATRRLVDADMSFHAIREYAPGDSRRQIHWKSTAKTGQPMVRQYEESRRSRMALVVGLAEAEFADAEEFELAVSSAASLSVRAIADARELEVVVGAPIPRVVRGRLRAMRRVAAWAARPLLDTFSGLDRLAHTMPLREMCRLVAESSEQLSIAVIVTGSTTPIPALRQAALAFAADTAVVAVVCDVRAHPRLQTFGALTLLTVGTLDDLGGLLRREAAT